MADPFGGSNNVHFRKRALHCPLCSDSRSNARALYWHIKIDHQQTGSEAYDLVGEACVNVADAVHDDRAEGR